MDEKQEIYPVDIILVINAKKSMEPLLSEVKKQAPHFYQDLKVIIDEESKPLDTIRVKVIVYRDYYVDGTGAMLESRFFELPTEVKEYQEFIHIIEANGGTDESGNGLEALTLAIKSDWNRTGSKRRHIIAVWSDASTHPLQKEPDHPNYPKGMPNSFDELTELWEGQLMDFNAKRLVMFTPDVASWSEIGSFWENTAHFASKAEQGLKELEYKEILKLITGSI